MLVEFGHTLLFLPSSRTSITLDTDVTRTSFRPGIDSRPSSPIRIDRDELVKQRRSLWRSPSTMTLSATDCSTLTWSFRCRSPSLRSLFHTQRRHLHCRQLRTAALSPAGWFQGLTVVPKKIILYFRWLKRNGCVSLILKTKIHYCPLVYWFASIEVWGILLLQLFIILCWVLTRQMACEKKRKTKTLGWVLCSPP